MSRKERRLIARANAANSTGPRTEAGKQQSSSNALVHGLTSKRVVLPHESQAEFDALRASLQKEHRAANDLERELVEHVAQTYWRLQRAYRVETAFLEDAADNDAAIAGIFNDTTPSERMTLLMRYIGSAERAYNKALADLRRMQAERKKTERTDLRRQVWLETGTDRETYNEPGFVSQPADVDCAGPVFSMGNHPAICTQPALSTEPEA